MAACSPADRLLREVRLRQLAVVVSAACTLAATVLALLHPHARPGPLAIDQRAWILHSGLALMAWSGFGLAGRPLIGAWQLLLVSALAARHLW